MSIKEGDMVSIRQDFINRYKNVQESIIKAMDKALERAIGNKVIEIDDSSCDGCVFNNRGYYCMYSCCCNIDRGDNTDVIYKEVKRS